MKLTDRAIRAERFEEGDRILWDDEVKGFGLRVKPGKTAGSGARSFLIQYRRGTTSRRMTIGQWPAYKTEEARDRGRLLLQTAREGGDPATDRKADRTAETVRDLCQRYLDDYAALEKKPSSVAMDRSNIENHVIPLLGKLRVRDVSTADIERAKLAIRTGKVPANTDRGKPKARGRRIVKGGPGAANRVLALLSVMFSLAEKWGIRPKGSNPCRDVDRYAERKLGRLLSEQELARLGAAITEAEQGKAIPAAAAAAIRLLTFTGARVGEILTLRWRDVDIEDACLNLPDSKTGAKQIHLNAPALEIINGLSRTKSADLVLQGKPPKPDAPKGETALALRTHWEHVREAAKIPDLRLHDLRHSFASGGVNGGMSLPIVGKLLGHKNPTTTQRYAHFATDPLKQAADMIGRRIAAAMRPQTPDTPETPSNVVPMPLAKG